MSFFDEMLSNENIPDSYSKWKKYRDSLTSYIENSFSDVKYTGRPVLALWGIGRSADMDLMILSRKYKLVLIDRDQSAVNDAVKQYGLQSTDYISADLPFWNVSDEDYRMFEDMLLDELPVDNIIDFLGSIALSNSNRYMSDDREFFDCSVAVGIHSQLNSRFAALLYHYRRAYSDYDLKKITCAISALNEAAVDRLNDYMYYTTKSRILYGYEIAAPRSYHEALELAGAFTQRNIEVIKSVDYIEGVRQLMTDISLHNGCDAYVLDNMYTVWPFDTQNGSKNYVMGFTTMEKTEQNKYSP